MKNSKRPLLFALHGWFSLPVWILFTFICLTGTISVVSHEITWLLNPKARATNPDGNVRLPLEKLVSAVQAIVPDGQVGFVMENEPYLVTAIGISSAEHPNGIAYVNPYTGVVQEIGDGTTFVGFMRSLHGWLLFPWHHTYSLGYYIVTSMSLVVLGAGITGVLIYKKFWRSYTRPVLRLGRDMRTVLGDLHRLAGAWSLWFLFIIGITGMWYLTQAILWHRGEEVWDEPAPVAMDRLPEPVHPSGRERIDVAAAVASARTASPSMRPSWIFFPEHNRGHYSISGKGAAPLFDDFSYRVFINPWDGTVAEARTPASMTLLQQVSHLADPLHYGRFGGLWSKAIWFLFGIVLSGMSVSGLLIWSKRTVAATTALIKRSGDPADADMIALRRMRRSRFKFLIHGFVLLCPLWFLCRTFTVLPLPEWSERVVGSITVAPTPADEMPEYAVGEKRFRDFSFRFCEGCGRKIRLAVAKIGRSAPSIDASEGILHGTGAEQHVHAPIEGIAPEDRLWLTLQEWDGAVNTASWPLFP